MSGYGAVDWLSWASGVSSSMGSSLASEMMLMTSGVEATSLMWSGMSFELAWLAAREVVESAILSHFAELVTASVGFWAFPAGLGLGLRVGADAQEEIEAVVKVWFFLWAAILMKRRTKRFTGTSNNPHPFNQFSTYSVFDNVAIEEYEKRGLCGRGAIGGQM